MAAYINKWQLSAVVEFLEYIEFTGHIKLSPYSEPHCNAKSFAIVD